MTALQSLPVCLQLRTFQAPVGMSQMCQTRKWAPTRTINSVSGNDYDREYNERRDQRKGAIECFRSSLCDIVERRHGLRWSSQFAPQPSRRFTGFHRIHESDHTLMNVIARGALECSDVKASGTRCDAGLHSSCSARKARWSLDDHELRLDHRRESDTLSHRWMPSWGGDGNARS